MDRWCTNAKWPPLLIGGDGKELPYMRPPGALYRFFRACPLTQTRGEGFLQRSFSRFGEKDRMRALRMLTYSRAPDLDSI
jgi:hypothetical protein